MTKQGGLFGISTALLVLLGALMPYGAARLQDGHLLRQSDLRELRNMRLVLQKDLALNRIFGLLTSNYARIDLNERVGFPDGTKRSAARAESAAREVLSAIAAAGLIEEATLQEGEGTIGSFLAVSESGDTSAVFWEYVWVTKSEGFKGTVYVVQVEDSTGKMTGFAMTPGGGKSAVSVEDKSGMEQYSLDAEADALSAQAERWAAFCRRYYGVKAAVVDENYNLIYDRQGLGGTFTIELSNMPQEREYSYQLALTIAKDQLFFNI